MFRIFNLVPINKVRVVLLAQDPYYQITQSGIPQAMGMSFSVPKGVEVPPSLKNIYKVLSETVTDFNIPKHGDLTCWAVQGIFLLNACLTVREGTPDSHKKVWAGFIKKVINAILDNNKNVIFLLWGKNAQEMKKHIGNRATILETSHPSPLGFYKGFNKCNHFNEVNKILVEKDQTPINWNVY